ncbi:MAG TPA: glycosyl hydrolase family 8 [Polyangia bacterium]|jgi:endo-1,4-beta-D-glucanase Y|nr:glycosyl hydrolase family 8 [Polyangia bacterium]
MTTTNKSWALIVIGALAAALAGCRSGSSDSPPGGGGAGGAGSGGARAGTGGGGGGPLAGAGGARDASAVEVAGTGGAADGSGGGPGVDAGVRLAPGLGRCVLPPAASDAALQAAYARWKTDLVTSDGANGFQRVRRPNSGTPFNSSNSEGIAYGMTVAVYLNDQGLFDNLWKYEQRWVQTNGLMNWEINPQGTAPSGTGAATDGDEDMAFALVMADRRWGGRGTLADTYLNFARRQIDLIWTLEVDHNMGDVLKPGDQFADGSIINISYFAPAYYRIFGRVSGKPADWDKVVESSYRVLQATLNVANGNASNGLVPAWSTPAGVPMAPAGKPTNHQLDSCRTPFRIAQDFCWFADQRAREYLQKISSFYAGIGATRLVDGYALGGAPMPTTGLALAAFVGPAGVGAMATPAWSGLRDDAYAAVASLSPSSLGDSLYYNESWTVLSLLMMTGRMADLTAP